MVSQPPSDEIADAVRERLAREDDVVAAYLFGSQARGTAGALSDVDVGVLLEDEPDERRELELRAALAEAAGSSEVDVVVLNRAPVALAYRVLAGGRLLLSRDERHRVAHWARTVDRYLDMAPMRRMLDAGLGHRLEEGRFGRS